MMGKMSEIEYEARSSDDLVARLRVFHEYVADKSSFILEAAARIEKLEKQFEELLVQNNRLEDFVTNDCVLRTEARLRIEKFKEEIMDVLEGK